MKNTENKSRKAWAGIVLVVLGGYFLLRNFHMIPPFIPHYMFGWEMVFILIGGAMMASGRRAGIVFLIIGTMSILPEAFYWWPHIDMRDWWPVILIVIGISIFLRRRDNISRKRNIAGDSNDNVDYIEDTSIFGGSEKIFNSENFKGGRITSIFGGSEIDFSGTKLSDDDEVVIDCLCLFGGNTLIVPNDWTVINESFVIFGGYADSRSKKSSEMKDPNKVLRIKGAVIFGGAEVKGV